MKNKSWLTCMFLLAAAAASPAQACSSDEVASDVKQLGYWKDDHYKPPQIFQCFVEHGSEAAGLLVRELHVVPEPTRELSMEDQPKHPDTMHVIWTIRALRAITGLDFTGGSASALKTRKPPKHFIDILRADTGDQVKFYGLYMSHEDMVIAPQDIQTEIISKWNDWYKTKGADFVYAYHSHSDDWYY